MKDADFNLAITGNVYAFDSTTIDLCLNVFWWATFRTTKAAIKIHTLYDVKTSIPAFIHITEAIVHDVNALDALSYETVCRGISNETGGFYVMDKAYVILDVFIKYI